MNIRHLRQFIFSFIITCFLYNNSAGQTPAIKGEKINFTTFTVCAKKNKVLLDWSTDSTRPTNYFEIQKSTNGKDFKTIALVLGPDPKQQSGNHYGCSDKIIPAKVNHSVYRIRHIDENGFGQLSNTKFISKT